MFIINKLSRLCEACGEMRGVRNAIRSIPGAVRTTGNVDG